MPPQAGTGLRSERKQEKSSRKSPAARRRIKLKLTSDGAGAHRKPSMLVSLFAAFLGIVAVYLGMQIHAQYAFSLRTPIAVHFQWPLVVAQRTQSSGAAEAQLDQFGRSLTAYQQYACRKFGSACRTALAIQRAENPAGKCEIYHYNADGTLDWGYFQINTVHLKRPGLNLRDLLDCRANIDFAYELYVEQHGFSPWSTYKNGSYLKFLRSGGP